MRGRPGGIDPEVRSADDRPFPYSRGKRVPVVSDLPLPVVRLHPPALFALLPVYDALMARSRRRRMGETNWAWCDVPSLRPSVHVVGGLPTSTVRPRPPVLLMILPTYEAIRFRRR